MNWGKGVGVGQVVGVAGVTEGARVPACAGMTGRGAGSCLRRNDGEGRGFLPAQE